MRNRPALRGPVFAILLTFFLLPAAARAGNVTVGCPGGSVPGEAEEHTPASQMH